MNRPVSYAKRCFLANAICFHILVLLLSTFCLVSSAFGQAATATLSGTVVDEKGAVIPGANVTIVNVNTQASRQTTTSGEGYFVFPLLQPSNYKVSVEGQGFSPVQVPVVVLNVGDQKALQIELRPGDVNAQVTIDSDTEAVRTDGSVGTVVDRQFVANMPLNGRSLQPLLQLVPGVILTPINGGGSATGGSQFSVNGQRTTSNYFMVDGISANTGIRASNAAASGVPGASASGQTPGTTALGGTNSLVSLDALQEFRIETSTFAAEFGRTPGGQISLVTRGGTNEFHGSASYYLRNEALDANDWFGNSRRQPKPKERQNLFGGVFGGPLKRERVFFFGSYEGLRLEQPQVLLKAVPTVAFRAQAASAFFPYLRAFPSPNGRDFGNGTGEFAASYSDPGRFNVFALRFDGNLSSALSTFFRVNHAPSQLKTRINSLSNVNSIDVENNSFTGGVTWVPNGHLTADVRVNWTRNSAQSFNDLDTFGGATVPNASDIFLAGRDPSNAATSFSGPNNSYAFTWGSLSGDIQRQMNVVGNMVMLISSHQLKFGIDYRRMLPLIATLPAENLTSGTNQNIVDGKLRSYALTNTDPVPRNAIIPNLSIFGQDTWHVNGRITLTYGMRFERVPPTTEETGRLGRTLLGIDGDPLQSPRLAPPGTPLFESRFGYFAPRLGLSYQLRMHEGWETTLRGGFGVFYDLGLGNVADAFSVVYPFAANKTASNITFPVPATVRTAPTLGVDPPAQLRLLDPHVRLPYTLQWNSALEQGLGKSNTVTARYVGAAGHRLLLAESYSQALVEWPTTRTTIFIQRNLGHSNYQALQVQFNRRLRRGVQALVSYTFGRSLDNVSDQIATFLPQVSQPNVLAQEYGSSDFDVRHVFSSAITYDIPNLSGPAFLQSIADGWGLDLLIRYQSPFPVSPVAGFVPTPDGFFYSQRPNRVQGQLIYLHDSTTPGGKRWNLAAFAAPAPNTQGDFPRNGLRAFPASQVDLGLRRDFQVGEAVRLQVRAELFNVFNHPNFGTPSAFTFDPLFGQPTSMLNRSLGGLNGLYQIGGPRSGQLSLKISF